jgi:hypothetical protein
VAPLVESESVQKMADEQRPRVAGEPFDEPARLGQLQVETPGKRLPPPTQIASVDLAGEGFNLGKFFRNPLRQNVLYR